MKSVYFDCLARLKTVAMYIKRGSNLTSFQFNITMGDHFYSLRKHSSTLERNTLEQGQNGNFFYHVVKLGYSTRVVLYDTDGVDMEKLKGLTLIEALRNSTPCALLRLDQVLEVNLTTPRALYKMWMAVMFFVAKEYRGKGFGKAIIKLAHKHCPTGICSSNSMGTLSVGVFSSLARNNKDIKCYSTASKSFVIADFSTPMPKVNGKPLNRLPGDFYFVWKKGEV